MILVSVLPYVSNVYGQTEPPPITPKCWESFTGPNGELIPCDNPDFQFDIDVPVFSTVKQDDYVRIPVEVTLVKGEPKEVALSTTTWQESLGIYGWFETSTVTPTQRTYLVVQTSCNTPPDNYQFYTNGVATSGDVPASSTDMVTVTVEAKPGCVSSQNNQQLGQQPIISGSIDELSSISQDLIDNENYQEALPYLNQILQQEPENEFALWDMGHALYALGRYEEAITYFDRVLAIFPDYYIALTSKGDALYELGRYEEALTLYYDAFEQDPEDPFAQWRIERTLEKIDEQNNYDSGGGCLIATATFGSELAPQVQFLREIRDNTVITTASGTSFMTAFNSFYYSFSPTVADLERQSPVFKETVKVAITPLLSSLSLLQYVDIDSEAEILGYGIGIILLNMGMYFVAPIMLVHKVKKIPKLLTREK